MARGCGEFISRVPDSPSMKTGWSPISIQIFARYLQVGDNKVTLNHLYHLVVVSCWKPLPIF